MPNPFNRHPLHGLKETTTSNDGTNRTAYHCFCGSFWDWNKQAFDYHVENNGKSPDADALATSPDEVNINEAGGTPVFLCESCANQIEFYEPTNQWVHANPPILDHLAKPSAMAISYWKMCISARYGKPESTPVDNTVHNHGLADMARREGMWGVIWIAFCECGVAFASVDIHGALENFDQHINDPAADEAKLEAHRARVAYSTRGDFTMLELFPDEKPMLPADSCYECGAFIHTEANRVIHLAWHNKLLP